MASHKSALEDAIAVGTTAVEAEKAGRLAEAKERYMEAVGLFLSAVKAEHNPQRQLLLKRQTQDFLQRAEELSARIKDLDDPLLTEARKLDGDAASAEASGDYLTAKNLRTKAIERYLEMMRLEPHGSAKHGALRRETEEVFARAERVGSVLKARERDAVRLPLERALQLEVAAREAAGRGEKDRGFALYSKAIEGALGLHGGGLWPEAAPVAERCMIACEALKKLGAGKGSGGGEAEVGGSKDTTAMTDATLGDGVSTVRYPSALALPFPLTDLRPLEGRPYGCLATRTSAGGGGGGGGSGGGGGEELSGELLVLGVRLLPAALGERGAGLTNLVQGAWRLRCSQPHRDCALQGFALRSHKRQRATAPPGQAAADEAIEDAFFIYKAPPQGAVLLAEWVSGERGGAGAPPKRCRPAFDEARSVLRQLLQELQVLHAVPVFGAMGRPGGGAWVCGAGGGAPFVVLPGLAPLEPSGTTNLDDGPGAAAAAVLEATGPGAALANAKRAYEATVAPELLGVLPAPAPGAASDMYQFAAIAFWALVGREWSAARAGASGVMPPLPAALPLAAELSDLLGDCLCRPPDRRPSPAKALRHAFFTLPGAAAGEAGGATGGAAEDKGPEARGGGGYSGRRVRGGQGSSDEEGDAEGTPAFVCFLFSEVVCVYEVPRAAS